MNFSPIDFKAELNDEQYAAVTADHGPALVLAGAGSGKTRTLTYRVAYLLMEKRIRPESILLLTFTNKAAREMTDRVRELTGCSRNPYWSGTFHSVGGRLLRQYGHHLGLNPSFTILDQSDSESLFTKIIKDSDKLYLKNKDNPKPKVILNHYSYARNTCVPFEELLKDRYPWNKTLIPKLLGFANTYKAVKLEQQVADYDDLLVFWHDVLAQFPEVRKACEDRFPCILVDEYQDTNTLQAAIINMIGGHHNIMAVGDDAQCIYTWRGANFENIQSFTEKHPGARIYKILTNYRSTPPILHLANSVLANQPTTAGYQKELVAHRKGHTRPYVVPVMDTRAQAKFVAARIEALYDEGVSLSEIAILYRAHYQALDTQLELTRQCIPFVITSGVRFFEQAHIKDFVAQLRLISNPTDSSAMDRLFGLLPRVGPATVTKIYRAATKELEKLQKKHSTATDSLFDSAPAHASTIFDALASPTVTAKVPEEARQDFESLTASLIESFTLLNQNPSSKEEKPASPASVVETALMGWYSDYIEKVYPDWQDRKDDLNSLVEFAGRFETMTELLAQLVLLNSETSNSSVDPDETAVRMTTIHQAKGLEFPVVFLISAADEMLPLKRAIEEGDVEEERRLFYVAVTRAMNELYISIPMMQSNRGSVQRLTASRFLSEINPATYDKLNYRDPNPYY